MTDAQQDFNFSDPEAAEKQLVEQQKNISFDVTEFPVESHVAKLTNKDYKIPSYQREYTWEEPKKWKFIESVLLGLPIPFIFGVVLDDEEGVIAIIDGVQRLNTLKEFLDGDLQLKQLDKLFKLQDYKFDDLSPLQQRKFRHRTIRMIKLDGADTSTQFDMFERINTTAKLPTRAEIRRGAFPGKGTDLIRDLANDETFISLTPMSEKRMKEREREELALRFVCYSNEYLNFTHDVARFLDDYLVNLNKRIPNDTAYVERAVSEFNQTNAFIKDHLSSGYSPPNRKQTPRVRFEALAVGVCLALRKSKHLDPKIFSQLEKNPEFADLTKSDASNSRPKLMSRIEWVRDKLLKNED